MVTLRLAQKKIGKSSTGQEQMQKSHFVTFVSFELLRKDLLKIFKDKLNLSPFETGMVGRGSGVT